MGRVVHEMRSNAVRPDTKDGEPTMKNADMPAHPIELSGFGLYAPEAHYGLTKREMFAMAAMQAQLSALNNEYAIELFTNAMEERYIPLNHPERLIAINAINYSDALLAELERTK